jgi:hypothetical protein
MSQAKELHLLKVGLLCLTRFRSGGHYVMDGACGPFQKTELYITQLHIHAALLQYVASRLT